MDGMKENMAQRRQNAIFVAFVSALLFAEM